MKRSASLREDLEEKVYKKFALMDIPPTMRTAEEKKELSRLDKLIRGEHHKFPGASVKKPSKAKTSQAAKKPEVKEQEKE